MKIGRNSFCSCGSGKKYKKCCGLETRRELSLLEITQTSKQTIATLLIIFTVALGIRFWFLACLQKDILFNLPIIDSKEFNILALQLIRHGWVWPSLPNNIPQNHAPLYSYFIAVIYKIFGFHINAVAIIQCLLGAASACLMYVLTLRMAGPLAAIVCAGFMTFYWFFIYTQVFLFGESLAMPINIVLVYYLITAKESLKKYVWAGLLLGASLLCRPDLIFFAGLMFVWIWRQYKNPGRALLCYGVFLLLVMAVLAPVLIRNHAISGSWTLRSEVGCNFYLGNDPDSYGSNIFVNVGRIWQKFVSMPYEELHADHTLTESEVNNFYIQKTFSKIADHPFIWVKLIFGKVWCLLTGRDFLRPEDVYFRNLFVSPHWLQLLSTRLIFILAVPGFLAAWKIRERHQWLFFFLLSYSPSIFFPTQTRYLVPIMPFVIFYASFFVSTCYKAIKAKDQRKFGILIWVMLLFIIASFINPLNLKEPNMSETYYAIADNLHHQKDYDLAEQAYRHALSIDPSNSEAWNDLSALYFSKQDRTSALDCLKNAADADDYYASKYEMARNIVTQGLAIPSSYTTMYGDDDNDIKEYTKAFRFPPSTQDTAPGVI